MVMDAPPLEDPSCRRKGDLLNMATIQEIAAWTGGEGGQSTATLNRVSALETASADAIVFAMDKDSLAAAVLSAAGAILASAKLKNNEPADSRIVWVRDARYAFSVVAKHLGGGAFSPGVHPTAVVDDSATLGEDSAIGPGATIGAGVKIGKGTRIDARVIIYPGVEIGDDVVVQAGAVLGATGFGYAPNPETGEYLLFPQQGSLVIEDHVEIGANTTIDRGALGETRIGRGTKIDNLVHIGHNCIIGRNVVIAAQTGISGSSVVEDGAILGGQVGVGEHATVGEGVILGGGAGVLSGKKMRGKGEVFWGRPARPLKEYLRDLARLKHR